MAIGYTDIFIKAAEKDSFTCIHNFKFPRSSNSNSLFADDLYNKGFCFVPGTDSLYAYDNAGTIYCLSFLKYDSIVIGSLAMQDKYLQSLALTESKKMYVITASNYPKGYAVDINASFSNPIKYEIAEYNKLPDSKYTGSQSDSIKTIDTVRRK